MPVTEFYDLAQVRCLKEKPWDAWSEYDQVLARCLKQLLAEKPDLWHEAQVVGNSVKKFRKVDLYLRVFIMDAAGVKDFGQMADTLCRLRNFAELAHAGFKSEVEEIADWPK